MRARTVCFYYVYIITNIITNKQYIGSRVCYRDKIKDDIYWGSSKYLNKDYEKYGKENFKKEILQSDYENAKDMLNSESEYILKFNTLAPNGYNRYLPNTNLSFHMAGIPAWNKGLTQSKEIIEKRVKKNTGKTRTEETKHLMSISHIGKIHSEETKKNQSNSLMNHIVSDETKNKQRKAHKGKPRGKYKKNY